MRGAKKSRRLALAGLAAALIVGVNASLAGEPYSYEVIPATEFSFFAPAATERERPSPVPLRTSVPLVLDPQVFGTWPTGSSRSPQQTLPPVEPQVEERQGPRNPPDISVGRATGKATWYCVAGRSPCHHAYPDRPGVKDMYAAAGGEIRKGHWRGRSVHVCTKIRCITVKLIDWCACGGPNAIDLYGDAFRALVNPKWRERNDPDPLGRGRISVTILWD